MMHREIENEHTFLTKWIPNTVITVIIILYYYFSDLGMKYLKGVIVGLICCQKPDQTRKNSAGFLLVNDRKIRYKESCNQGSERNDI